MCGQEPVGRSIMNTIVPQATMGKVRDSQVYFLPGFMPEGAQMNIYAKSLGLTVRNSRDHLVGEAP